MIGISVPDPVLKLLYTLYVLVGNSYRVDSNCLNSDTSSVLPVVKKLGLDSFLDLFLSAGKFVVSYAGSRDLCESRCEYVEELSLELIIKIGTDKVACNVAGNICEEEHRIRDPVRIYTVTAYSDSEVSADVSVVHSERNGILCTELVVHNFLHIEVVDALILCSIAAVLDTLPHFLECVLETCTE